MEFSIRKSEVGFEYFLRHQLHAIRFVVWKDKTYPISKEEQVGTFARANRLMELYDLFILALNDDEKAIVNYLIDSTPAGHKKCPENYNIYYVRAYERWIEIFFGNNVNCLPSIDYKILGRTMRFIRKERKIQLAHLADVLEIDYSLLSRYETGERTPSLEFIFRFCVLLKINIDKLLSEVSTL